MGTLLESLITSVFGMAVVFAVLVGLIILIKILNMAVARPSGSKKPIAVVPAAAGPVGSSPVVAEPVAAAMPVFSGDPQDLKLIDVDEQTAAIIMAIVCDELDTPVNELYFKSIRLLVNQVPAQIKEFDFMKYVITINSKSYEVEVEKGEARVLSVAAAAEPVTYITPAPAPVAVAQEAAPAAPVAVPAAAPVAAPVAAPAAASKPAGGDTISAPMPGTIISIQKRVGDHVRSGDVVLILEAMKMENEIVAMSEGTITHILTSKGAVVSTGDPLITIG